MEIEGELVRQPTFPTQLTRKMTMQVRDTVTSRLKRDVFVFNKYSLGCQWDH